MTSARGGGLYAWARPLLFRLDPEVAHGLVLTQLDRAHRFGLLGGYARGLPDDPVEAMGLRFPNPVGLAAGLDKNAAHVDALGSLGFGFVEVGTVTPLPQAGNPRPRLFRLPQAEALINRFGFNNEGLAAFVARLPGLRYAGPLGLNLGKNAATPNERALDDYAAGLRAVYPHAAYVTINISSPNTRNLRALQGPDELGGLLRGLAQERARLADEHGRRVPLAVKIAPDLDDEALRPTADILVESGVDAVIATNTTIARTGVDALPNGNESGGLSGRPLFERSTAVVAMLRGHLQGRLPIIGVGGILEGRDAVEKMRAGADLVQLYTGLIYRGPALVAECRRALLDARRATSVSPHGR